MDCGGKRRATPLWMFQRKADTLVPAKCSGSSKAVSPLRCATALQIHSAPKRRLRRLYSSTTSKRSPCRKSGQNFLTTTISA